MEFIFDNARVVSLHSMYELKHSVAYFSNMSCECCAKWQEQYSDWRIMIKYTDLDGKFLIQKFPELEREIVLEEEDLGEFLPHCLYRNVLNPLVVDLLKKQNYLYDKLLVNIFSVYEDMATNGDMETQNLLQVTLLEYLWDEKVTYERAKEMMGTNTRKIWKYIHKYISAPKYEKL